MFFPSDTHQPPSPPPPPPPPPSSRSPFATSDTPHSDSGRSFSSSSSSEIMGTPFDLGAPRFEYPFPPAQGSPTDPFLPLSSSIPPLSHSHAQLPPWPIHITKSFPLTPPPLGKPKAHPKLRTASAREPPVPPGLVKRRSRIAGVKHQSSSEEPSDRSDVSDDITRARRPSRVLIGLTEAILRKPHTPDGTTSVVPIRQAVPSLVVSCAAKDPPGPAMHEAGSAEGTPRPLVLQRERRANRVREEIYSFTLYCWIVASQLSRWLFRFLGWFSRT